MSQKGNTLYEIEMVALNVDHSQLPWPDGEMVAIDVGAIESSYQA